MKVMKKISAVLLSLCLMVPCFSMVAFAADGRISFTDPSTAVGEYVEVKCVLRSTSGNMGDVSVDLSYDEAFLRFDSGDGIETSGSGALSCSGAASSAEVTFVAKFQALQEGTTKVEVTGAQIADSNGLALTLDQGNSTITIAAGDPSKITADSNTSQAADLQVDVNGVSYTLTDNFADADIPNGYARTQRTLDGTERQMVENESGNVCLGYMTDAEGNGDFFLYNEETATFSPYAEISISDIASIIVLSDASQVSLPNSYQEAKLSLNDKEFPVWQDTDREGIYVLYAMNNSGETGYYQYDSKEGTYQRFEPAAMQTMPEVGTEAGESTSVFGKIQNLIMANFMIVLLAAGVVGVIIFIVLIVLAVKLHNRNAEIDELYDEYGIDLDEEEEVKPVPEKKETKKALKKDRKNRKEDLEEEFFEEENFEEAFVEERFEEDFEEAFVEEEFIEEDFEEEFIEEDFVEEELEEFEDYRESKESFSNYKPETEFTGYTERMDFTIDDLDELLEEKAGKKSGHVEDDDTFKMDFIDLD